MHMQGHVDSWCQENCNPRKFEELNDVNQAHEMYAHYRADYA